MSDIKKARELLRHLSEMIPAAKPYIDREIMPLLYREPYVRRAEPSSRKVTSQVAKQIRAYAAENPEASMQEIAVEFETQLGRVSEALNYKR